MLSDDLKKFGLDENETKLYLTLLELGPSTVTEVTKKAAITRTLGYVILEKLGIFGLVTRASGAGKKMKYAAEHPRNFIQYVKNKKSQWERNLSQAENLLPDLMALYKVRQKPVLRYQQGVEGVMPMYEEALEAKGDVLSILDVESWQDPAFWDWAKKYNRERNRQKVRERILLLDSPAGREWIKNYRGSRTYTVYRWVQPEDVTFTAGFGGELHIYNNRVMFSLLKKPDIMGVTIESPILSTILKSMFELAWKSARPVQFRKR